MNVTEELRQLASEGYSRKAIAKHFGRSLRWVDRQLFKHSISTHAKPGPKRVRPQPASSCLNCNGPIKKNAFKFCSNKCQKAYDWCATKRKIEESGFISDSRQGRKYFIEKTGNICEICGTRFWNNQDVPLVLDHKDGNPENWSVSNLRLICPNCDALTPTYKNRNRGNGRFVRRRRYKEGKSY